MDELELEAFNAGVLRQTLWNLQEALSPVVQAELERKLKQDWLNIVNRKRAETKASQIRMVNGRPDWDEQQICHVIRSHRDVFDAVHRNGKDRVMGWVQEVLDARNKALAHSTKENRGELLSNEETYRFLDNSYRLLKAFGLEESASKVLRQREACRDRMAAKKENLETPEPDEPEPPPEMTAGAAAAEPGLSASSSAPAPIELLSPGPGVVYFPVVGSGGSQFGYVRVRAIEGLRDHVVVPPMEAIAAALREGRSEETSSRLGDRAEVYLAPARGLRGESYGLAIAVADKMARYGIQSENSSRPIYATGVIVSGGRGAVGAIGDFQDKIALIERDGRRRSLFVFPRAQLSAEGSKGILDRLDRLKNQFGIEWRSVDHVNDLSDLWQAEEPGAASVDETGDSSVAAQASGVGEKRRVPLRRTLAAGAGVGVLAIAAALLIAEFSSPKLDPAELRASDDRLRALNIADAELLSGSSVARCMGLVNKAQAITETDRSRWDGEHEAAFERSAQCRRDMAQRDERLRVLEESYRKSRQDRSALTVDGLARAFETLNQFDLSGVVGPGMEEALKAGSTARAVLAEADDRNRALVSALERYRTEQTLERLDALSTVLEKVDGVAQGRMGAAEAAAYKEAKDLVAEVAASRARLSQLVGRVELLKKSDTPRNRDAVDDAFAALTAFDREVATPPQMEAMAAARSLPSKGRLRDLHLAWNAYEKQASEGTRRELIRAMTALKSPDRKEMAETHRAAETAALQAMAEQKEIENRRAELIDAWKAVENAVLLERGALLSLYRRLVDAAAIFGTPESDCAEPECREALRRAHGAKQEIAEAPRRLHALMEALDAYSEDRSDVRRAGVRRALEALNLLHEELATTAQRDSIKRARMIMEGAGTGGTQFKPIPGSSKFLNRKDVGHPESSPQGTSSVSRIVPGRSFRDCPECPEMVVLPAGNFTMGSDQAERGWAVKQGAEPEGIAWEAPQHSVTIKSPFAIGKHEVTRGQYAAFVKETGRSAVGGCFVIEGREWVKKANRSWENPGFSQTDDHPVVCVTWDDAAEYAEWLSGKTGRRYLLPSEAQWEYAARGGSTSMRYWGDDLSLSQACAFGNFVGQEITDAAPNKFRCSDGYPHTAPAGTFRPNAYGLHDMLGNVGEYIADCWNDSYANGPFDDSPLGGDCLSAATQNWSSDDSEN